MTYRINHRRLLAIALAATFAWAAQAAGSAKAKEPVRGANVTLGKNPGGGPAKRVKNQTRSSAANAQNSSVKPVKGIDVIVEKNPAGGR